MSNLISPQKRAENHALADAALKKAQGFTKKTLMRWKPDWEQAGRFYRDAVKYYKMSGDDDGLIQACRESAVAHDELGQFLTAAQDLETAASVLVKEGSSSSSSQPSDEARKRAYELYRESALAYRKHSNPDKSAQMLVKAAECIESVDPRGLGLEALQDACLVYEEEQRGTLSDSTFKKAIGYAIKNAEGNDFTRAIELIQRQNEVYKQNLSTFENDMYKNFLCIVVLTIQSGDVRRAAELLETFSRQERFMGTDVYEAGNSLVQAMEEQDDEALATALKRSPFKYIMNQVAVIARKLKIGGGGGAAKKPKSKPAASGGGGAGAGLASQPEEDDADDFT